MSGLDLTVHCRQLEALLREFVADHDAQRPRCERPAGARRGLDSRPARSGSAIPVGEELAMLERPPIIVDNRLRRTSAWANTFLERDHFAKGTP